MPKSNPRAKTNQTESGSAPAPRSLKPESWKLLRGWDPSIGITSGVPPERNVALEMNLVERMKTGDYRVLDTGDVLKVVPSTGRLRLDVDPPEFGMELFRTCIAQRHVDLKLLVLRLTRLSMNKDIGLDDPELERVLELIERRMWQDQGNQEYFGTRQVGPYTRVRAGIFIAWAQLYFQLTKEQRLFLTWILCHVPVESAYAGDDGSLHEEHDRLSVQKIIAELSGDPDCWSILEAMHEKGAFGCGTGQSQENIVQKAFGEDASVSTHKSRFRTLKKMDLIGTKTGRPSSDGRAGRTWLEPLGRQIIESKILAPK